VWNSCICSSDLKVEWTDNTAGGVHGAFSLHNGPRGLEGCPFIQSSLVVCVCLFASRPSTLLALVATRVSYFIRRSEAWSREDIREEDIRGRDEEDAEY